MKNFFYIAIIFAFGITKSVFAIAGTDQYYALDHAAVKIKNTIRTPLIAITKAGQNLFAAGQHGVIIRSQDNGVSWQQMSMPVDVTLTEIYFSTPTEGWAVGHYGVVLHTDDAGLTWTKVLDGNDVIEALRKAAEQAVANPVSAADTQLKSRVATAFRNAGPSKPFLAVERCGDGILVAGQQDMAMFSLDGKTWREWTSKISNPNFLNIYAIMNNEDTPYLIGEGGLLLKGDANCQNFKPMAGPYTATLFGGEVLNAQNLLVYGLDGGLYISSDAGTSWTTITIPSDAEMDSDAVMGQTKVILSTLSGSLYLYDADTQKLTRLSVSVPFEVSGIVVAPNGNLVVVGSGGVSVLPPASLR
jgi:photosystem II stability/assembly factor-like uncharacterized protein